MSKIQTPEELWDALCRYTTSMEQDIAAITSRDTSRDNAIREDEREKVRAEVVADVKKILPCGSDMSTAQCQLTLLVFMPDVAWGWISMMHSELSLWPGGEG